MEESRYHFVEYEKWCKKCSNYKLPEDSDPCNECLTVPVNTNSRIPINYNGPRPSRVKIQNGNKS